MQYIRAFIRLALRIVRRLLTPSTDSIVADFEHKIGKLNKVINAANDDALAAAERRSALRREIDRTYDAENAAFDAADRASTIRRNLENIINA